MNRNSQDEPGRGDAPVPVFVPLSTIPASDPIDFREIFGVLSQKKMLVLASVAIGLAIAVVFALLSRPVYSVEVVLAPVTEELPGGGLSDLASQFGGLANLAGVDVGGNSSAQEAVAKLRSKAFTMHFIEKYKVLASLYASEWDAEAGAWKATDADDIPSAWDGFVRFDRDIRHIEGDGSGLVTVRIEWSDPVVAATWANDMVALLNEQARNTTIAEANKSIDFLQQELTKTSVLELQTSIYRMIEAQISKIMLANVREDYAFKVIDPGIPPDRDDFIRPNRPLIIVFGFAVGLAFGMGVAFLVAGRRDSPHE